MGNTDRLYRIEMLIRSRGEVTFRELQEALEVSRATLKRDLAYLRDRLNAPIEFDRYLGAYRFGQSATGDRYELPGLWFNEAELYSLLMTHQLLSDIDSNGVLSRHLQPMLERVQTLLGGETAKASDVIKRVRIVTPARRPVPNQWFERVAEALIQRKRLALKYLTRSRGESGERVISPQRLMHYRSTWYVDAWCHKAEAMRRFALDAIEDARLLDDRARDVATKTVEAAMDAGYGVYAGGKAQWATLVFEARAAQWISHEQWHPQQQGRWRDDGRYELKLPYAEETELVMDILRHGEQVQVAAPASLVKAVRQRLQAAARQYG